MYKNYEELVEIHDKFLDAISANLNLLLLEMEMDNNKKNK